MYMKSVLSKSLRGFTLIELLIVIAVIGILMVAVLSAINPVEQIRKASDTRRKSDAAEFLNALERYYATTQCYPWEISNSGTCTTGASNLASPVALSLLKTGNAPLASGTGCTQNGCILNELLAKNEIKKEFLIRGDSGEDWQHLWVTKDAQDLMHICFWPESKTFQTEAKSRGYVKDGSQATCTTPGVKDAATACHTCLPQ